jgi:hypothetical protein
MADCADDGIWPQWFSTPAAPDADGFESQLAERVARRGTSQGEQHPTRRDRPRSEYAFF